MEKTCRLVHITYRENNRGPRREEYKGALNLSVRGYRPLTSFPVSDRSVTQGEYEGPKAPYRRLLFSLVVWQQNGRTVRSGRSYLNSLSLGGGM